MKLQIILTRRDNRIYVLSSQKKDTVRHFCTSRFHLKSFSITPFESTKFPRVDEVQLLSNSEDYRGKTVHFTDWQPASFSSANHIILTRPDNALLSANDNGANVSRSPDQKPHRKTQTKMKKFPIRVIDYQGKLRFLISSVLSKLSDFKSLWKKGNYIEC